MDTKYKVHLVGDIIMYTQLDTYRIVWTEDERTEFVNILKSINQKSAKVLAYVITKNSIHLIIFSQDIKLIQNFLDIFQKNITQVLKFKYKKSKKFFRKDVIYKNIISKDQFLNHIKLFQEIPEIKKSR